VGTETRARDAEAELRIGATASNTRGTKVNATNKMLRTTNGRARQPNRIRGRTGSVKRPGTGRSDRRRRS